MTTVQREPVEIRQPAQPEPEQRFVLYNIPWAFYERCLRQFAEGGPRLTYDHGVMEMMTTSEPHEWFKSLLGRMIEAVTEELGIPIRTVGSTTRKRRKDERGFEPDESYYIASEPRVRGKTRVSPSQYPPDLIVEIDITSSSLPKLEIFATFKVPEVWRYDGRSLRVYVLTPKGRYVRRDKSLAFPFLPLPEIERFLERRDETDETTWIRSFRAWVRQTLVPQNEGRSDQR